MTALTTVAIQKRPATKIVTENMPLNALLRNTMVFGAMSNAIYIISSLKA